MGDLPSLTLSQKLKICNQNGANIDIFLNFYKLNVTKISLISHTSLLQLKNQKDKKLYSCLIVTNNVKGTSCY